MQDDLTKMIATIKETMQEQTDSIKEQRRTIDKQTELIDSLCANYQSFVNGIMLIDLPEEIRKQSIEVQILLEQIKS